ncbi:hypothetical protein [Acidisphaera sp. L21]|uniref:hypothetical protein n=1 Tax=Acidisphaera sp. L21 TaxID=1641851 RepID=UPI00131A7051|nr:hypothetical protein [Acidisphaera sp. L21]
MPDHLKVSRPNPTKAFFDLEMRHRSAIAQRLGLAAKADPEISDLEQSKLWVSSAQELGKRDTFNDAVWRVWENSGGS